MVDRHRWVGQLTQAGRRMGLRKDGQRWEARRPVTVRKAVPLQMALHRMVPHLVVVHPVVVHRMAPHRTAAHLVVVHPMVVHRTVPRRQVDHPLVGPDQPQSVGRSRDLNC